MTLPVRVQPSTLRRYSREFGREPVGSRRTNILALLPRIMACIGVAKPRRRFDQRVEHGLQIEGRAADHLEHVGGGGLLLQRLAQLVEQARVLDGDDGLVGEVLTSSICLSVNGSHYGPTQQEAADGPLVADERNAHGGTVAELLREIAAQWKLIAAGGKIGHMDHLLIQDGPPGHPAAPERSHRARAHRTGAVMRYSAQIIALAQEDDGVVSVAQASRRLGKRLEHGLQIERRAADDLEHVGGGGLLLQLIRAAR